LFFLLRLTSTTMTMIKMINATPTTIGTIMATMGTPPEEVLELAMGAGLAARVVIGAAVVPVVTMTAVTDCILPRPAAWSAAGSLAMSLFS